MDTHEILATLRKILPKRRPLLHHEPFLKKHELGNELVNCAFKGITGRDYLDYFEQWLAKHLQVPYVVLTNSGTSALHLALLAAGVKYGDEVIVPTNTFVATANAITMAHAAPHFVDGIMLDPIRLKNYLLKITEPNKQGLGRFHKQDGRKITAIVVVHLFGHAANIVELKKVADELNLLLIEDACQALGTTVNGKQVGTFGAVGVFSFNNNKILTTNGGGAVVTSNPNIYYELKKMANTGRVDHPWKVEHDTFGFNYRMNNINAAVGCTQIVDFGATLAEKRALAARYRHHLSGVEFFPEVPDTHANYWLNTILVDNRDELLKHLHADGIMARASFTPLHSLQFHQYTQANYKYVYNIQNEPMTDAMNFWKRAICLPSGSNL